MSVQLGNIASSFIYRDDDKPYYRRGNRQLVAINFAAIAVFALTKACRSLTGNAPAPPIYMAFRAVLDIDIDLDYIYRNKQRDRVWDAMTQEERENYTKHTKLEGSRRLDFRFAH